MKRWSTTPVSGSSFAAKAITVACAVMMAVSIPIELSRTVQASNYDARIAEERAKQEKNLQEALQLSMKAETEEEELARTNRQIDGIRGQIGETQVELESLAAEIEKLEADIEVGKRALRVTILDIDASNQISTLEVVASSKNIGDIVNNWEQQNAVQSKLNDDIKKLSDLRREVELKQEEVAKKMDSLQAQRDQVAAIQAEQARIVDETRGEEAAYREMADRNNARVQQLIEAQAEENRRAAAAAISAAGGSGVPAGVPGGGGYPGKWANAPINAYVDNWGLYSRQCVSYTAWKVWSTGRFVPHFMGAGNANQWPTTAAKHGISNGSTPKVGSVAIQYIGYYGHSMYVEAVNSDGTIVVSDYNLAWDGVYRKYTRSASGLTYIYF